MEVSGQTRSPIVAAVDAGTNSVHLLVAAVSGRQLQVIADDKIYVRLGTVLEGGRLGPHRSEVVAALARFSDVARGLGAERIALIGTEPLRRAADASEVADELERAGGPSLAILSHAEEGLLTMLGVTRGAPITRELLVADIGGGSSELVLAAPDRPPVAIGLRLGTARLMAKHVTSDPPTRAEVEAMRAAAAAALEGAPGATPEDVVVVGGAVSNLTRVVPEAEVDRWLDAERLAEAVDQLTVAPAAAVAERLGIHPVRAHTLPAGVAVVGALLDRYRVQRVRVSEATVREGAAIALARAGDGWREALPRLAGGDPE